MIPWPLPACDYPTVFTGIQVDCCDPAKGRFEQRQPLWADERLAKAEVFIGGPIARWKTRGVPFIERIDRRPGHGRHIQNLCLRIEACSRPTGSPLRAR